jgi:hypothetical protein
MSFSARLYPNVDLCLVLISLNRYFRSWHVVAPLWRLGASTICQEQQDLFNEIGNLRRHLQLKCIPKVSEKFKHTGTRYNTGSCSKLNTFLAIRSWEPGRKELSNRRHNASIVFPVMWQKLHWRNKQTSSRAAPWTYPQSQRGYFTKIKISPTCLSRRS